MNILAPSMLSADYMNLESEMKKLEALGVKWLHVDIMDGHFVPNLTFGYSMVSALKKVTSLTLDVHLMIDTPIKYIEEFINAGADYITLHIESDTRENIEKTIKIIKENGVKAGLSVKPNTPAKEILPFIKDLDLVLVMTVEPGFGGQKFMADMMPKLKALSDAIKVENPACKLEVDGGINEENAKIVKENGANVLVAGSAYFKSEDKEKFIKIIEE